MPKGNSREADGVPEMNCNDAREGLSVLTRDGMGLTEWVLADAHVRQCAECRKALENLQEVVSAGRRVAPHRALQRWLNATIDAIRVRTTSVAAWVSRVRVLLSIPLTVLGLKVAGVIRAGRVGATWGVGLLTQVRLPNISELPARTAAIVVAGTGFVIARCADVLGWPRSFRWVTRGVVGVIEPTRAVGSRSLALFIQVGVLLPILVTAFSRAAARLIGRVATGFAHRLLWCCSSLGVLFQGAAQAAIQAARIAVGLSERASSNAAETTRFVIAFTEPRIAVGHAWVRKVVDRFMRVDLPRVFALPERATVAVIEATRDIGPMVLTMSRDAVRLLGRRAWTVPVPRRDGNRATMVGRLSSSVRALAIWRVSSAAPSIVLKATRWPPFLSRGHRLGLGAGVVCLAALIAVTVFLWPRPRPANVTAQFASGHPSQHGGQPADPTLAELVIAAPLAQTSVANSISSLQTVPPPQPKTFSEAMRPRRPEAQAAIPAPSRRREPVAVRDSASAPVPNPSWSRHPLRSQEHPEIQHAEGSDGSAAIDWLVKRGRETSRAESP
jgi:hypothetical protein